MSSISNVIQMLKAGDGVRLKKGLANRLYNSRIARVIPDKIYIKAMYYLLMGKSLDLKNPKTFTEKLQWLKLYNRRPEYKRMVDKYEAKQYVSEIIGDEYIIPTIGVWDSFDEIDFSVLPNQFVLKCTHDSGSVVLCRDKKLFDKDKAKKKLSRGMKNDMFWIGREWPYKGLKHRIIAEQYMEDTKINELRDYKFFCFNGQVRCYKVDFDRFIEHHANYFDAENNLLKFGEIVCPPVFSKKIEIPESIEKMKNLAEKLAAQEPFLRADFYDVDGKVYFGELTFFPDSGFGSFYPEEWDLKLGEWMNLEGISLIVLNDIVVVYKPSNHNLLDVKMFCFDGEVRYVYVSDSQKHLIQFYDSDFQPLDIKRKDYKEFERIPSKPKKFDEMKRLAKRLSKGISHLRVDFYEINNRIFFGELTFYTASGFLPFVNRQWDEKFGAEINLPVLKNKSEDLNEHINWRRFGSNKIK